MRAQDLDSFTFELRQVMPDFEPFEALWNGDARMFLSETSARYALRAHREALIAASALAMYRGRVCFHRERFLAVMRAKATSAYAARFAGERAAAAA